jgi:hypothetical protein
MDDYYECENLPFDSKDDVQMYQIPVNSMLISKGSNNIAATAGLLAVVVIIFNCMIFMFSPALYAVMKKNWYIKPEEDNEGIESFPYNLGEMFLQKGMYPTRLGTHIVIIALMISIIVLIVGSQTNNANAIMSGVFIMTGVVSAVMGKRYYEATKNTSSSA